MDFAPHTDANARARAAASCRPAAAPTPNTAPAASHDAAASQGVRLRLPPFYVFHGAQHPRASLRPN